MFLKSGILLEFKYYCSSGFNLKDFLNINTASSNLFSSFSALPIIISIDISTFIKISLCAILFDKNCRVILGDCLFKSV